MINDTIVSCIYTVHVPTPPCVKIFPNDWKLLSSGFNNVVFSSVEYCPMCDGQMPSSPQLFQTCMVMVKGLK